MSAVDNHLQEGIAVSLTSLKKVNLREQALASLRTAITSGQLSPTTPMVETELSEQLQISRGTLREAMRQLQQEGLLEEGARGRLYVRSLGRREIIDIFEVRAALEGLAARTLAERGDRAQVAADLRSKLAEMAEAVAQGDLRQRIEADLAFHARLCALTGNETLMRTWQVLSGSIRMSIMFAGTEKAVGNMDVARHDSIVDAIEAGDGPAGEAAVVDHMSWAALNLTGDLDRQQTA